MARRARVWVARTCKQGASVNRNCPAKSGRVRNETP